MSIKSIGQNTAKALIVVHLVTSQIDAEIAYAMIASVNSFCFSYSFILKIVLFSLKNKNTLTLQF